MIQRPCSRDIIEILQTAGLGTFAAQSGQALFEGKEPESPDDVITVYDTPAPAAHPHIAEEYSRFQMRSRSNAATGSYARAYGQLLLARNLLFQIAPVVVAGTHYAGFWGVGDLQFLEFDTKDRAIWTLTMRTQRGDAALGYRF